MNRLLRAEGVAVLAAALVLYIDLDGPWWLLLLLFLAPDLAMLGYLAGPRVGSGVYNALHSYAPPVLLFAVASLADAALGVQIALIWLAHIGLDRALGYGLKYPSGFKDTHLGRV